MKPILHHLLATATLFAFSLTPSQAVLIDFNDSSDLNTFFNATGNAGAFEVPATNTIGLNNSGSIRPNTSFSVTGARVFNEGFSGTTNEFQMSIYFNFDNPTSSASFGSGFYMGIGPSATYSPSLGNTAPNGDHILVGFQPRTTTGGSSGSPITKYALFIQEKENGAVLLPAFSTLTSDLVQGNWYYLEMQFTYDVDGYDLNAQLFDAASDGTVGSALAGGALSATDMDVPVLSGGDVYAFIGNSDGTGRGFAAFDNFAVVPEPTSAALLLGALGLGAWRRRRSS